MGGARPCVHVGGAHFVGTSYYMHNLTLMTTCIADIIADAKYEHYHIKITTEFDRKSYDHYKGLLLL